MKRKSFERFVGPPLYRFGKKYKLSKGGCWLWTGATGKGYARFNNGEKVVEAHRWIYEKLKGKIPKGLQIDHLCRIRHCVNPEHMEPVTSRENTLRGESIIAKRAAQTHCLRGHEFTKKNTYVTKNNQRKCLKCHAFRERRRRERVRK